MKSCSVLLPLGVLAASVTLANTAQADVVLVAATGGASGNTVNATTASPANQTDWFTGNADGSGINRTDTTNSDNLWLAAAGGTGGFDEFDPALTALWETPPQEDAPELQTTVSFDEGIYDIYVLYSTAPHTDWEVSAGLNGDTKTVYTKADGTVFFDKSEGPNTLELRGALLGQVTGTSATVEVDDDVVPAGDNRSRYVGVAYELVPEPSSLALLGLGGLLMTKRRRRD